MKKLIVTLLLIFTLFLTSCYSNVVSYLAFETPLLKTEPLECDGTDTVYFYVDRQVYNVSVDVNEYSEQKGDYVKLKTVYTADTMSTDTALLIKLNLKSEIPYVSVSYSLEGGKTRQQFIYCDANNKLWLLEQK